jgi:hypothetical protein
MADLIPDYVRLDTGDNTLVFNQSSVTVTVTVYMYTNTQSCIDVYMTDLIPDYIYMYTVMHS